MSMNEGYSWSNCHLIINLFKDECAGFKRNLLEFNVFITMF